ncbi:VraH family peptide resistance protein [Staphylococcus succinus]|nr:VraH family protein [Staphylococcus succinus]
MNMEVKSKSFVIMIVSIIILSIVFTPFIGVPAGFIIGSYSYSKH